MGLKAVPISLKNANEFVMELHRHHAKVQGHKFSVAAEKNGKLVGVAIIGRPVSRHLDDGNTLEITRLCTDGTKNVCSFLYSKATRIAKEMGYAKIITYTLQSENGTSLISSGWVCEGKAGGGTWKRENRPRQMMPRQMSLFPQKERYSTERKIRWGKCLK